MRYLLDTNPSANDVSVPDVILPEQFFEHPVALSDPERRLRLAVLRDAFRYVERYEHATDQHGRMLHADALEWIADPDRDEPFAFENVCEALGFNPSWLRRVVDRWRNAQVEPAGPSAPRRRRARRPHDERRAA
jgi:hypothetical protein